MGSENGNLEDMQGWSWRGIQSEREKVKRRDGRNLNKRLLEKENLNENIKSYAGLACGFEVLACGQVPSTLFQLLPTSCFCSSSLSDSGCTKCHCIFSILWLLYPMPLHLIESPNQIALGISPFSSNQSSQVKVPCSALFPIT